MTVAIVLALFAIQKRGTASVGRLFGPVMCVWFVVLAVLGALQLVAHPAVLGAIDPRHAIDSSSHNPRLAFLALGAVVLAVTGTEALYADMGHFGASPIRRAWLWFVMPALVLNYFGQGALLLEDPAAIKNPFYLLAPQWALIPLVVLATCAAVIASQAVISGAFSLTRAAIQMGYCPRLKILHTSDRQIGQIYVPFINWTLLVAVVLLVVGFRSSDNLGGAYGIAVTLAMLIDSVLIFVVMRRIWGWSQVGRGAGRVAALPHRPVVSVRTVVRGAPANVMALKRDNLPWFVYSGVFVAMAQGLHYSALAVAPILLVAPVMQTGLLFRLLFSLAINRDYEVFGWAVTSARRCRCSAPAWCRSTARWS